MHCMEPLIAAQGQAGHWSAIVLCITFVPWVLSLSCVFMTIITIIIAAIIIIVIVHNFVSIIKPFVSHESYFLKNYPPHKRRDGGMSEQLHGT